MHFVLYFQTGDQINSLIYPAPFWAEDIASSEITCEVNLRLLGVTRGSFSTQFMLCGGKVTHESGQELQKFPVKTGRELVKCCVVGKSLLTRQTTPGT